VPHPDKSHDFDLTLATIEHIYPQNPPLAQRDAQLEPHTHKLGNLSIWAPDENQNAGNQPFLVKKPLYDRSIVRLNKELASLSTWDDSELQKRRTTLIDIAKLVFKV